MRVLFLVSEYKVNMLRFQFKVYQKFGCIADVVRFASQDVFQFNKSGE